MQSNDAIEVVAPLGGGISEVALFPDAAAVLASTAGGLVEPGRIFHAAGRHLSSLKSDVALFVRRIEIPVIGRDGEIAGVLCRNSPLTSASRSTPLTQDQDTAIIGDPTKRFCTTSQTSLLRSIVGCGSWSARRRSREGN
jgi:hypothetical protein